MSREEQFDFYWKEIFDGLAYNPIEFNVYRFDQSMSLPNKFNKLYEMFKQLALNNQEVMDYLKEFVETFDFKLETTVTDILNEWENNGELEKILNEYYLNKIDPLLNRLGNEWSEWVEQNKEIIESVDPAGTLMNEIIIARGLSETLGERLNELENNKEKITSVSYTDFGANGNPKFYNEVDGQYYLDAEFTLLYEHDDGIEILQAHEFANENGLKVINKSGHYVVKSRNIPVLTDVNLYDSVLHIDESYSSFQDGQVFSILPSVEESERISKTDHPYFFLSILEYAKKGSTHIPPLSIHAGKMGYFGDNNKLVGKRSSPQTIGDVQHDWFLIKEGGYIDGEISWDYEDLSYLQVKEIDHKELKFKGGTFLLNDKLLSEGVDDLRLRRNGLHITRSNVTVEVDVYFEKSLTTTQTDALCQGFITGHDIVNLKIINSTIPPRKLILTPTGQKGGTYSISCDHVINLTLENVNSCADRNDNYWGVMGTNYIKNMKIINCKLNRIDCHFYALNVDIVDSFVDSYGIYLAGMGILNIINTRVRNKDYLQFRDDYGCLWDGEINIENPQWVIPDEPSESSLISFSDVKDFDHGYDFVFGNKISVKNVSIKFENKSEETILNLIKNTVNKTLSVRDVYYPSFINFTGVTVEGRDNGVDVYFHINRPDLSHVKNKVKNSYYLSKNYVNILKQNADYIFKNIKTSGRPINPNYQQEACIRMITTASPTYDYFSLLPKIVIDNSDCVFIALNRALTETLIEKTKVTSIVAYFGGSGQSHIHLRDCVLQPDLSFLTTPYQITGGDIGFNNVLLKPMKINESIDLVSSEKQTGIFMVGENAVSIYYASFINFVLDPRLINHFKSEGVSNDANILKLRKELQSSTPRNFFDSSSGNVYTI